MNWKMTAMIFRLATSVLEKRRESISVVPNWDSLQNLRAKINKAAAERLEAKRVPAAGRLVWGPRVRKSLP